MKLDEARELKHALLELTIPALCPPAFPGVYSPFNFPDLLQIPFHRPKFVPPPKQKDYGPKGKKNSRKNKKKK